MFRLAHISDVHFSPMPKIHWREMLNKRLTGYMNWHKIFGGRSSHYRREHLDELMAKIKAAEVDHLAITGDFVNLGLPHEFFNVANWLTTIGKGKNISAVLGNHDEYIYDKFLSSAYRYLRPYMADGTPYVRVKHNKIAIIGVNSAEPTLPLMAHGYFRKPQAKRLAKILIDTRHMFRIILIHHPPITSTLHKFLRPHKNLFGARLFQNVIKENGCELVLHGHTHKNDFAYIGNTPVIGTTSASAPDAQFNLFTIYDTKDAKENIKEKTEKTWNCKLEVFSRFERIAKTTFKYRQPITYLCY